MDNKKLLNMLNEDKIYLLKLARARKKQIEALKEENKVLGYFIDRNRNKAIIC